MRRPARFLPLSLPFLGLSFIVCGRPAPGQEALQISSTAIAGVRVCDPLTSVRKAFPQARDTLIGDESDSDSTPGTIVHLSEDQWILFETSSLDPTRIWRIATNSPRYRTGHGYRVGMSVDQILRRGEKLSFGYPEGYLAIDIVSENIGFQVEESAARRFFSHVGYKEDPLRALDKNARIKLFGIGRDCRP